MTVTQAMQHLIESGRELKNRMIKTRFQKKTMTQEQMTTVLKDNKYIIVQAERWQAPNKH